MHTLDHSAASLPSDDAHLEDIRGVDKDVTKIAPSIDARSAMKVENDLQVERHHNAVDLAVKKEVRSAHDVEQHDRLEIDHESLQPLYAHSETSSPAIVSSTASTVVLTSKEQQVMLRNKAVREIQHLISQRAERDAIEASLVTEELSRTAKIWQDLAIEHRDDPPLHAHCEVRKWELLQKVTRRTQYSGTRNSNLVGSESASLTADQPCENSFSCLHVRARLMHSPGSGISPCRTQQRSEKRKLEAQQRAEEALLRSNRRTQAKAKREATKQALMDQKFAAARAEKEISRMRRDEKRKQDVERIERAHAKVSQGRLAFNTPPNVDPKVDGATGDSADGERKVDEEVISTPRADTGRICGKRGLGHATFAQWKECLIGSMQGG